MRFGRDHSRGKAETSADVFLRAIPYPLPRAEHATDPSQVTTKILGHVNGFAPPIRHTRTIFGLAAPEGRRRDPSMDANPGIAADTANASRQKPQPGGGRRKGTACARCRSQKIKCDDETPSCLNCAKAGQPCIRANLGNNPDAIR